MCPAPASGSRRYAPIDDYAIIGDCRSAALVSRRGSIDWLCLPYFASPSVFGALLDERRGGRFRVTPAECTGARRNYVEDTNVLETHFRTRTGAARLVDDMPAASEREKNAELWPDHLIVRTIECTEGEVEVEVVYEPRPDYGRRSIPLRDRGALGIYCQSSRRVLVLRSELPLTLGPRAEGAYATITLQAGEKRRLALTFAEGGPAILPPLGQALDRRLENSIRWWREWVGRCSYEGPYRDAVVRSALVLKLLTFAPSGAVVAAPTTSLPEQLGGQRNWDYRYCWLRDASLTLQALLDLGYRAEGEAFLSWLLHTTRLTRPALQMLYGVFGETDIRERHLDHLEGHAHSTPVRIGNAATSQLQLDTYGELIHAVYEYVSRGGHIDRATARLLRTLGNTVCRRWREPDESIWEIRSDKRHHTYSRAMCWVALDRLLKLHGKGELRVPVRHFEENREAIRNDIETHGFDPDVGSYVSSYGARDVDAALMLLNLYGYAAPDSARMQGTCRRLSERLARGELVYRYRDKDDGLPGDEGAFVLTSFWMVRWQAVGGSLRHARESFEALLERSNDVGLYSEEIDPESGAALGNFPQAFSHVGLIDAALMFRELDEARPHHPRTQSEPEAEAEPQAEAEPEAEPQAEAEPEAEAQT